VVATAFARAGTSVVSVRPGSWLIFPPAVARFRRSLEKTNEHQPAMRPGDSEFHDLTAPVLDSIANEGLQIARENGWKGLVIEMDICAPAPGAGTASVRCTLMNGDCLAEVDEPSASMLDAARRLQGLFMRVGTPLAGVTIDWIGSGDDDGRVRRRCSYRYH